MVRRPYTNRRLHESGGGTAAEERTRASGWTTETIVFFLILYAASMKDDANPVSNEVWASIFWAELTHHPIVLAMKGHVSFAAVAIIFLATWSVLRIGRIKFAFMGNFAILALMATLALFRVALQSGDEYVKMIYGLIIVITVVSYMSAIAGSYSASALHDYVGNAVAMFAFFLIAVNALEYVTDNGVIPGESRMFGTAGHPNFTGVQLALSSICLFIWVRCKVGYARIAAGVGLVAGLFLVVQTGSRTALVMVFSGMILAASSKFTLATVAKSLWFVLAAILLFVVYQYADNGLLDFSAFSRGLSGEDTRSSAWLSLLGEIAEHPLWGNGTHIAFSENSYLRAWAAYGIVYAVLLVALTFRVLASHFFNSRRDDAHGTASLFLGLIGALLVGGIFEGYLLDVFSVPMVFLVYLSCLADSRRARPKPSPVPGPALYEPYLR